MSLYRWERLLLLTIIPTFQANPSYGSFRGWSPDSERQKTYIIRVIVNSRQSTTNVCQVPEWQRCDNNLEMFRDDHVECMVNKFLLDMFGTSRFSPVLHGLQTTGDRGEFTISSSYRIFWRRARLMQISLKRIDDCVLTSHAIEFSIKNTALIQLQRDWIDIRTLHCNMVRTSFHVSWSPHLNLPEPRRFPFWSTDIEYW